MLQRGLASPGNAAAHLGLVVVLAVELGLLVPVNADVGELQLLPQRLFGVLGLAAVDVLRLSR